MIVIPRLSRRKFSVALLAISICLAAGSVRAQLAPSQPIKIVVGVPAGGLGDLAARVLAQRLSENGHPAIVENRLGGNGIVATDAVAKSRPDGYTLIMGNQRGHPVTAGQGWTRNPCFMPMASAYLARCPALPRTRGDTARQPIL